MSLTLDEVRHAALALPPDDRLHLVDALQESMGPAFDGMSTRFESAAAFEAEMERRLEAYLSGADPGHAWEDVQKEAYAILRQP